LAQVQILPRYYEITQRLLVVVVAAPDVGVFVVAVASLRMGPCTALENTMMLSQLGFLSSYKNGGETAMPLLLQVN